MIILIEKTISMKCAISKKGKTMLQRNIKWPITTLLVKMPINTVFVTGY